jgi:hypothetical protein
MDFDSGESPLARNSDPWTSHEAGEDLTASGKRSRQKYTCLRAALRYPIAETYTAREFACDTEIKHEIVHKRFPDLHDGGLMYKRGYRTCTVTGKKATVWSAYPAPEESNACPAA